MIKRAYTLIILLFSFSNIFSQNCDQISGLIKKMPDDTNKVNLLYRWAGCMTGSNPDSVILLCNEGAALAQKLNFTEGVFKCVARATPSFTALNRYEEAKKNIDFGYNLAVQLRDTFNILRFIQATTQYYIQLTQLDKALEYANEGIRISFQKKDEYRLPDFYNNIGNIYQVKADYKKAIEYFLKALPIFEKQGYKRGVVNVLSNIALCYDKSQADWDKYAEYVQKSLQAAKEIDDKYTQITVLSSYGMHSYEAKDTAKAIKALEEALNLSRSLKVPYYISLSAINAGWVFSQQSQSQKGVELLEEGVAIGEKLENQQLLGFGYRYLADAYYLNKAYDKSIAVYDKFLNNKKLIVDHLNRIYALDHLSRAYAANNNFEKAYLYHKEYTALSDSVFNNDNKLKIKDLENKYQLDKKEDQLKILNQEKALYIANLEKQKIESERQRLLAQSLETSRQLLERDNALQAFGLRQKDDSLRFQELQTVFEKKDKEQKLAEAAQVQQAIITKNKWILAGLIGLLLIMGFFFYFWRIRQKAIADKKIAESELKALRSQLNPHFLFNSMNAINGYILDNDKLKASEYLAQFAGVMRGVLETSRNTKISLEKELQLLENYMRIEQKRIANSFDYQIVIDESVDTFTTEVPAMLLQPFVENAIWHGFLHKPDKGHLTITATHKNNQLVFIVEDDGIGRQKAKEWNSKRDSHQSFGVKINEERLQLINNTLQKNTIKITDLVDSNGFGCGTRVEVFISER